MKKIIFNSILYIIFAIGILGASGLVGNELSQGNVCPQIGIIPACYVILAFFIALLLVHILKLKNIYFYIIVAIPISIALYGALFQLLGTVQCPKTDGGIPMCFISLGLFSGLMVTKYFISKK